MLLVSFLLVDAVFINYERSLPNKIRWVNAWLPHASSMTWRKFPEVIILQLTVSAKLITSLSNFLPIFQVLLKKKIAIWFYQCKFSCWEYRVDIFDQNTKCYVLLAEQKVLKLSLELNLYFKDLLLARYALYDTYIGTDRRWIQLGLFEE